MRHRSRILVINGANLNLLGYREPMIYGSETYPQLVKRIKKQARKLGMRVTCVQSNSEGKLVRYIQKARKGYAGIVINPGAYTHTSVALLDALRAVNIPAVEVHLTDPNTREEFRKISYIRAACIATIVGKGTIGYEEALNTLNNSIRKV